MMAMKRLSAFRTALAAIIASLERFGDEYLDAGGVVSFTDLPLARGTLPARIRTRTP